MSNVAASTEATDTAARLAGLLYLNLRWQNTTGTAAEHLTTPDGAPTNQVRVRSAAGTFLVTVTPENV